MNAAVKEIGKKESEDPGFVEKRSGEASSQNSVYVSVSSLTEGREGQVCRPSRREFQAKKTILSGY